MRGRVGKGGETEKLGVRRKEEENERKGGNAQEQRRK